MGLIKKIFTRKKSEMRTDNTDAENSTSEKFVKLKDEFDRDVIINKDVWIKDFLRPAIEKNWNNLEVLYSIILDAFNNNVFAEMKDAVMRIYNLDKDRERGTNFLGIYYANCDMNDDAKIIYEKYMETEEPSEIIFSNYAVILEKEGRISEAQKYFWKSIEIHPNMKNSLNKVLEFSKNKSNEEYYKNLYKISTLPNSWSAKLLKANYEIKLGNIETALVDIKNSLEESDYNSEVVTAALAIYGNNKKYDEIENNILPYFNPVKHGPHATSNVLKYLKISEKYEDALYLIKNVSSLNWNQFTNEFIKYEDEFIQMKKNYEAANTNTNSGSKVLSISRPIWSNNFKNPTWALNMAEKTKPSLLILPFTNIGETSTSFPKELSIALPLFLNDELHYSSNLKYHLALTYNDKEFKVPKNNYNTDYIDYIKAQNPDLDYILSGNILSKWDKEDNRYELEVYIYDTNISTKTTLLKEHVDENSIVDLLPKLLNNLNLFFNGLIDFKTFETPDVENILLKPKKLEVLMDLDGYSRDRSWAYNKILYNAVNSVIESENDSARFDLVSLLHQIMQIHPQLLSKVKPLIYNLVGNGYFISEKSSKLLPLIFSIYSDEDNYNNFVESIRRGNPDYIEWINKFLYYTSNE